MSPAKRLPTSTDVLGATRAALRELETDDEDRAAVALAVRLASAIDQEESGRTLAELAGKLLNVLAELGATPAARKAILPKGGPQVDSPARTARDELRERRAARSYGAADLDAASS
ncbi:hypothetical protein [Amycolatopsis sp. FDAARGOS 1241]|uniref:terminase small subunit n=1 Tax=Amycolatopsis sp. FDAARGOS 1241 TaxID=2778070 RepID=UPI00194E8328|nr:hypothetical protein [Amycolatopsis sp. FDAARGOS 1241]QRP47995.1 hypothetical protein I6J71_08960 [Amycolatopsis sp. FDAARGOS 1241]